MNSSQLQGEACNLLFVADGHGGAAASDSIAKHLFSYVLVRPQYHSLQHTMSWHAGGGGLMALHSKAS